MCLTCRPSSSLLLLSMHHLVCLHADPKIHVMSCHAEPAAAGVESASKKAKQQQAAKPGPSSAKRQLAVVGDTTLAATRPAIVRELYSESAELSAMPESEVQQLLEERRTAVEGSSLRPVMSFEQTGLGADMLHSTRDFVQPSPIQSQVRLLNGMSHL